MLLHKGFYHPICSTNALAYGLALEQMLKLAGSIPT